MIVFDLDRTIWDCYDKYGNQIWAKQLIKPFTLEDGKIIDDVGSVCFLMKGIYSYIKWLNDNKETICYCSVGRYQNLPDEFQPSINILKVFNLFNFFNGPSILEYKTFSKNIFLEKIKEPSIFYDDNETFLKSVSKIKNFKVKDAKLIKDWEKLIIK